MVRIRDYVDQTGGSPRLRIFALISAVLGTVSFGVISGTIDVIGMFGGGVSSTFRRIGGFLQGDLIGRLFSIGSDAIGRAAVENSAWLVDTFGVLAYPIAVIEVMLLLYLAILITQAIARAAAGGIA